MKGMNKFEYALYLRRQQVREHRSRALEQQRKRIKKQERKETIILVVSSIIILSICFITLSKLNDKDIKNCTELGYSKNYCESRY